MKCIWSFGVLGLLFFVSIQVSAACTEWQTSFRGTLWDFQWRQNYDMPARTWRNVPVFSFPVHVESEPAVWLDMARTVETKFIETCILKFRVQDDFDAEVSGYHKFILFVNDAVVWEEDVAGPDNAWVQLDLKPFIKTNEVELRFRALNAKKVTNFGCSIQLTNCELWLDGQKTDLLTPWSPPGSIGYPPDLPLPSAPVQGFDWTRQAIVLQPWGKSQYDLIVDLDMPEKLRDRFGFNCILLQPPAAYNRGTYKLTNKQFTDSLDAYRAAGYKIILYSSIMHCGHGPEWQSGKLAQAHPGWLQRDAEGGVISKYGSQWLCPSTGALEYCRNYTRELVEQYHPDGIMLDNNEFLFSNYGGNNGPTCYCQGCQKGFRHYLLERFGAQTQSLLNVRPDEIQIPTSKGVLYNLWLHWRNRVWACANETFREAFPGMVLLANTQYLYKTGVLATDLQYYHEDVVLSESRSHSGIYMSAKMLLGQTFAQDKALWNYLGTFRDDDINLLKDVRELQAVAAPTLAYLANPYLVYYGFDRYDEENKEARGYLTEIFTFRSRNPRLFEDLKPVAEIGTLISTRSRNFHDTELIPSHVHPMLLNGYDLSGIHDEKLAETRLDQFRFICAERVSCLGRREVQKLFDWVRKGGCLITTSDLGIYDQLGFPKPEPEIALIIGEGGRTEYRLGAGRIRVSAPDTFAKTCASLDINRFSVQNVGKALIQVRGYTNPGGQYILHIVNHGDPAPDGWTICVPEKYLTVKSALLYSPEKYTTEQINISQNGTILNMPSLESYAVIVVYPKQVSSR